MRLKTVTERYNAVLEGTMAKREFVRQMRNEYPMHVTQFNGFDDSVQILKNRGLLFEAKKEKKKAKQYDDRPALTYSLDALDRGIRYELESEGVTFPEAEKKAKANLEKDSNHYLNLISGESSKVDKHDKMKETKRGAKDKDTYNDLKKATLKEAGPSGFGTGQGRSKTISKGREERPDLKAKQAAAVKKAPKYVMKNGVPHKFDADGNLVPLKKVSEDSFNNPNPASNLTIKAFAKFLYRKFSKIGAKVRLEAGAGQIDNEKGVLDRWDIHSMFTSDSPNKYNVLISYDNSSVSVTFVGDKAMSFKEKIQKSYPQFDYQDVMGGKVFQTRAKDGTRVQFSSLVIKPGEGMSEGSTLGERLREALSDPAKLEATKAIKAKYPEVTAGLLDQFFDMHGDDISNGADPLDEFTEFFYANFEVASDYADIDEKKGKDHDGDGDVDGDDYMAAKDKAIKKAMGKDVDEDQERDHNFYDNKEKAEKIMQIAKDAINLMDEQPGTSIKDAIEAVIEDMGVEEAAIPEKGISLADALERYSLGELLDTAAEFYDSEGEEDVAELSKQFARDFRDMLDKFDPRGSSAVNENKLKEAIKSIITRTLTKEYVNEAATNQLASKLEDLKIYPGAQQVINQLENIVTEVESFYGKTRDKIQKVYDSMETIENEEGLKIGVFIGPSIESAFLKDLRPVTKKGFTHDLQLPKAKQLDPEMIAQARAAGDIDEAPEDDKQTVFTPSI